eukprot:SAG11_NODE_31261_length_293_cov_0.891753_1_plen_47_part_10
MICTVREHNIGTGWTVEKLRGANGPFGEMADPSTNLGMDGFLPTPCA